MKNKKQAPLIVPEDLIPDGELLARKKSWEDYYEKVRETRAYKRFYEMKELSKKVAGTPRENLKNNEDWKKFKELKKEARQAIEDGTQELKTPEFPDPELEKVAGRGGTVSYWKSIVKEARLSGREVIYKNEKTRAIVEPPTEDF